MNGRRIPADIPHRCGAGGGGRAVGEKWEPESVN